MKRLSLTRVISALFLLTSRSMLAVDGQVLINQSTVTTGAGFPYRITAPGSYKLTGNLVAPVNKVVIQIESSNVTLDLNGFNVKCSASQPGGGSEQDCINSNNMPLNSIVIRNGSVSASATAPSFNYNIVNGVNLQGTQSSTVEDVHFEAQVTNYSGTGLLSGAYSIIRRNTFSGAASPDTSCPSLVQDNVNGTLGAGSSGSGCVFVNNVGLF